MKYGPPFGKSFSLLFPDTADIRIRLQPSKLNSLDRCQSTLVRGKTFRSWIRDVGTSDVDREKVVSSDKKKERKKGGREREVQGGMAVEAGRRTGGQLTCSEYTIPFPKRLDVNCTLVAYLRFGVDMSVTR